MALGATTLAIGTLVTGLARATDPEAPPPELGTATATALGLAFEAQRVAFDATRFGANTIGTLSSALGRLPGVRAGRARAAAVLEPMATRGAVEQARLREEAQRVFDAIIPRIADAVVSRVDLDAIIDRIDYDAVIDRVPIDRVLDRVDYNSVVDRLDLTGIVADSTSGIAGESLDTVRLQSVRVDHLASRVFDTLLRRKGGRRLPEQ